MTSGYWDTASELKPLLHTWSLAVEEQYYVVFPIFLPPLRYRKEDIPSLCEHFLEKYRERLGKKVLSIDGDAMGLLTEYPWPGNVRELENAMQRAILTAEGNKIAPGNLPDDIQMNASSKSDASAPPQHPFIQPMDEVERQTIRHALKLTNGNISSAASQLGIPRNTFYRKLKKYSLSDSIEE